MTNSLAPVFCRELVEPVVLVTPAKPGNLAKLGHAPGLLGPLKFPGEPHHARPAGPDGGHVLYRLQSKAKFWEMLRGMQKHTCYAIMIG